MRSPEAPATSRITQRRIVARAADRATGGLVFSIGGATGFLAETSPTFAAAPLPTERFNQALVGEDLVNYACQDGNKLPGSAG
jgi:hypothetical protein